MLNVCSFPSFKVDSSTLHTIILGFKLSKPICLKNNLDELSNEFKPTSISFGLKINFMGTG